jgi:hypothetical protein
VSWWRRMFGVQLAGRKPMFVVGEQRKAPRFEKGRSCWRGRVGGIGPYDTENAATPSPKTALASVKSPKSTTPEEPRRGFWRRLFRF